MERYRSGHNGADSKSVCAKAHGGSNPPLSAKRGFLRTRSRKDFLAAFTLKIAKGDTMSYLNYEFFDEFKSLDNLCKDIYGESFDNRLGVTLYLDDMESNAYRGALKVPEWTSDYNRLKNVRNIRNELAHSRNSFSSDICSQEDIDFIRSFRTRILNQTDPIAQLRTQKTAQSRPSDLPQSDSKEPQLETKLDWDWDWDSGSQPQPRNTSNSEKKAPIGCFSIIALCLIVVACLVPFFI